MKCNVTSGPEAAQVEVKSDFVWAGEGTDLGATSIVISAPKAQELQVNLLSKDQGFFRETEIGLMFFGTYRNAVLTAPGQTVHVIVAYEDARILGRICSRG